MVKVLALRCEIAKNPLVPKLLVDAAGACLQEKPESRPTAKELSKKLDQINSDNSRLLESGFGVVDFEGAEFVKLDVADGCRPADSDDEEDSSSIYECCATTD